MASCICKVFLLAFLTDWMISAQGVEYVVHVYTANKNFAGTDAAVSVQFFDKDDKLVLGETKLRPKARDPYEKGDHDVARIQHSFLGELSKLEVKRGSSSSLPKVDDWDLDRIVVEDPVNNFQYTFNCDCDIDKSNRWWPVSVDRPFGCRNGYHRVNGGCEDVNECQQSNPCSKDSNALCTNTVGSYHCRNCKPGYSFSDGRCQDVNECHNGEEKCEHECTNTEGSYRCTCYKGFILDGKFDCSDVDECAKGTHICDHRAKCVNNPGSYSCDCPQGYKNDPNNKVKCINENECLKSNACDYKTSERCVDYEGGYRCECKSGFYNEKDNVCKDINECQGQHTCDLRNSVCENLEGNYRCNCLPGFIPSVNGKSCTARTCNPVVVPNGAMVRQSRCTKPNANSVNDVCSFYCIAGYQITDPAHTQLTCGADASWKGTPPTCKPVQCLPLRVPTNGIIRPSSCGSSGGTFQQSCSFICNDGYDVNGADDVKCLSSGTWSDSVPTCNKVAKELWIVCPPSIHVDLKPGESTADVSSLWKSAQTSSDAKYLTSSHKNTDRFPAGTTLVTWSVSNDNVNFKTCTEAVNVQDNEKPVAVNCPSRGLLITTRGASELVKLPTVQFTDNVAVRSIQYQNPNPILIMKGYTKTVVVEAKDRAGNLAQCSFDVYVEEPACSGLKAPVGGQANCPPSLAGYSYCQVSCLGDKVLFNATGKWSSRIWDCQQFNLIWTPSAIVPDCVDYVSSNGSQCPSGKVLITTTSPQNAAEIVQVCGGCPSGTYYENNECKQCLAGTYQDKTGESGPASCTKCPPGTSSKDGSKRSDECRALCAPGYFSEDGFHPCMLCHLGEYQSKFGGMMCDRCPSDRNCTRYQGASSLQKCGPCASINRIEPSGNVQRVRGSLLEVFCYIDKTTSGSFNLRWNIRLDTPGQSLGGRIYQKKLNDDSGKQIGVKLSVRDLQASSSYECVLENQFVEVEKEVHVTVINATGSGGGSVVSDEEVSLVV